ncbi:MAG: hypothetical protein ACRD0Y_08760 [Terriglobales bacterium]
METFPQSSSTPASALRLPSQEAPEQEAAFFFGLFLRGYSYQELRQDIEVPPEVQNEWQRNSARDPNFASVAGQMLAYRRRVLAIFQSLIAAESPIQ